LDFALTVHAMRSFRGRGPRRAQGGAVVGQGQSSAGSGCDRSRANDGLPRRWRADGGGA
jgi:hypothetical protein